MTDNLCGCPCPDCLLARIAEMKRREEEGRKAKEKADNDAFFDRILKEQESKTYPCGRTKP